MSLIRHYRLRIKILLILLSVFVVAFAVQGFLVTSHLHRFYIQKLNLEQIHRLESMAQAIDHKLLSSLDILAVLSEDFPASTDDPDLLQAWLSCHHELLQLFGNGLFVFSAKGHLLAEAPFRGEERRGRDFSYRPYYKDTLRTLVPQISDPYESSLPHGHKTMMYTIPILSSNGELRAILGGSFDLMGKNFLGSLSKQRLGESGYFFMVSLDRKLISHPDKSKLMLDIIPPGFSPLLDRVIEGFEGCMLERDCGGAKVFFTAKRLSNKHWVLCSILPMHEMLIPVLKGHHYLWKTIGFTALTLLLVTTFGFRALFKPLFDFAEHLRTLAEKSGAQRLFTYHKNDELGDVINVFNNTLQEMDCARDDLHHAQKIAHIGSWHWSLDDDRLIWSDEVFRIFGEQPQAFAPDYKKFLAYVHAEDLENLKEEINRSLLEQKPYSLDHRITLSDGSIRWVHEEGELQFDEDKQPVRMVGTVQDISERVELLDRLHQLATVDELTGVINRRQLVLVIEAELARFRRYNTPFSILFLDLDHFKAVNDTYGHQAGDEVLRQVCQCIQERLRANDVLGRYGGEEFCVVMPDGTDEKALSFAHRIREAIEHLDIPVTTNAGKAQVVRITLSAGITTSSDLDNLMTLFERADRAVYQAKESGRNCCVML